jgi:hypothetical protein
VEPLFPQRLAPGTSIIGFAGGHEGRFTPPDELTAALIKA